MGENTILIPAAELAAKTKRTSPMRALNIAKLATISFPKRSSSGGTSSTSQDHSLVRKLKLYTDPTLLLIDELGYLSLDQQTSNLFYQVISTRHSHSVEHSDHYQHSIFGMGQHPL